MLPDLKTALRSSSVLVLLLLVSAAAIVLRCSEDNGNEGSNPPPAGPAPVPSQPFDFAFVDVHVIPMDQEGVLEDLAASYGQ